MASKRAERRRSCERKRAYPDKEAAWRAAHGLNRQGKGPVRPYPCPWSSHHLHIGHAPRWVRKAAIARERAYG